MRRRAAGARSKRLALFSPSEACSAPPPPPTRCATRGRRWRFSPRWLDHDAGIGDNGTDTSEGGHGICHPGLFGLYGIVLHHRQKA
ncbi:MAG: hypothetical protein U5N27_21375 [Rhizobium sp.]|nr:hypothetical protein [Rhizobium sp.]